MSQGFLNDRSRFGCTMPLLGEMVVFPSATVVGRSGIRCFIEGDRAFATAP